MDKITEYSDKAARNLKIADHILTQTYPSLNDPKLLLAVLENLFLAMNHSLTALLHYEEYHSRIPKFQDEFDSKLTMFKLKVVKLYKITPDVVAFIHDLKSKVSAHKKSPVEFGRKDQFVMCSDTYQTQVISATQLKKDLQKTKLFLHLVQSIIAGEAKK